MTALADTGVVMAEYLIGALMPVILVVAARIPGWRRHAISAAAHVAIVAGGVGLVAYLLTYDIYAAGAGTTTLLSVILWWQRRMAARIGRAQ